MKKMSYLFLIVFSLIAVSSFAQADGEPVLIEQVFEEEAVLKDVPPPPPPPPAPPEEPIYKVVEEMPRFPGCEEMEGTSKEKGQCAKEKMFEYIYANLVYPKLARLTGVEGMTVVQFVVNKQGGLQDIKVVRDIGAGCGAEAVKVIEKMNADGLTWRPGKQRGRAVHLLYTLPVRFELPEKE